MLLILQCNSLYVFIAFSISAFWVNLSVRGAATKISKIPAYTRICVITLLEIENPRVWCFEVEFS